MRSRSAKILAGGSILALMLSVSSWGAAYDVISPKSQKPVEKKQAVESDALPGKNLQLFQPDADSANPCPNETGWLLSTMPLTSSEKKDDSLSKSAGSAFLPEDMQKELMNIAAKENISVHELCGKLNKYKTRLEEYAGDPQEYNRQRMLILDEMLDCRKSCGKILNKFAGLYTESSRVYYSGIVRFNFGSRKVENSFKGDKTHGLIQINNEDQLKAALSSWEKDPSQRIQLDARSSIPGSTDVNDRISRVRAEAVQNWLTAHGVPASRISIKWLGKYGPLINSKVARAYNIEDIFNDYKKNQAKQSTSLIGSQGIESFFDGLNQSVCIFVLP
jgi:outer membrane protein OmpA-like peptidoglycan-associated protein